MWPQKTRQISKEEPQFCKIRYRFCVLFSCQNVVSCFWNKQKLLNLALRKKCLYSEFSGPDFSTFGQNAERYQVSLRIQSECGKTQTRKTPNMETFYAVWNIKKWKPDWSCSLCKIYTQHVGFTWKISILSDFYQMNFIF